MSSKQMPWEAYPEIWRTEKHFLAYLRGAYRSIWSRYPAKLAWKKAQGVTPPDGYKGRAKKLAQCKQCNNWFSISSMEVDHIKEAGSFSSIDESFEWFKRIIDVNDNWQLLCKPCHKIKSHASRKDVTFEEALLEKKVIAFGKLSTEEQKQKLTEIYGSDKISSLTNKSKRLAAYKEWLKGAHE